MRIRGQSRQSSPSEASRQLEAWRGGPSRPPRVTWVKDVPGLLEWSPGPGCSPALSWELGRKNLGAVEVSSLLHPGVHESSGLWGKCQGHHDAARILSTQGAKATQKRPQKTEEPGLSGNPLPRQTLGRGLNSHQVHGLFGPGGETEVQRGEGLAEKPAVSRQCPRRLPVLFSPHSFLHPLWRGRPPACPRFYQVWEDMMCQAQGSPLPSSGL